jgi:hypothetical protein
MIIFHVYQIYFYLNSGVIPPHKKRTENSSREEKTRE